MAVLMLVTLTYSDVTNHFWLNQFSVASTRSTKGSTIGLEWKNLKGKILPFPIIPRPEQGGKGGENSGYLATLQKERNA